MNLSIGGNTQGTTSIINSGTVNLVGGSNITLSEGSQGITIIGNPQGFQGYQGNIGAQGYPGAGANGLNITIGGNTAGTNAIISSGKMTFVGGNNITLSQNNNALTINANLLNYYNPTPIIQSQELILGSINETQLFTNSISLIPFSLPTGIAAEYAAILAAPNFTTASNAFTQTCTWNWGIYSRATGTNSTQLSLMGSNSFSFAAAYSSGNLSFTQVTTTYAGGSYGTGTVSGGTSLVSAYGNNCIMFLGLNSTILPGQYWFAIGLKSSATTNVTTGSITGFGNSIWVRSINGPNLSPIGSTSKSTGTALGDYANNYPGFGYIVSYNGSLANSIGLNIVTRFLSNAMLMMHFSSRV
jgi:hypothetical protein